MAFRQFSGVCRLVYNLGLEQRRDWHRQFKQSCGKQIGFASQCFELTELRRQFDWIAAVCYTAEAQALRDLDKAFANFFSGRSGYPTPRRKGVNETFRFVGSEVAIKALNGKWSAVRLPKIGWVKFRASRAIYGEIRNVTVALDALGWHVNFACRSEHEAPINVLPSVGIDRGVVSTLMLSNGEAMSVPSSLKAIDLRHRRAMRCLSRKSRGSKRHGRQLKRCAALSARRARIRRHWHHVVSLDIAQRFGTVVIEALKVRNMTASASGTVDAPGRKVPQKSGLNRSILNQGWYSFETILAYKLEERGGALIKVNPAYTSQTCSGCGTVDSRSRESQASFACIACGFRTHADHNAAINILRRNTASTRMEEGHWLSVEVRTGQGINPLENHRASA